ncbi:MAG: YHS domain-containing protein [Candidatus Wukongarchaeota archaeon]|nr:YHS domain-containing protein [Candidatus Wukongarchaeota archaeon]MDO8127986.1 YHS domain-containing protein [Candidatus Wukongarchaeota archaeon]
MAKDLVCGMEVDEKKTPYKTEYERETYYFCCQACKEKFEKNPEKYLK